MTVTATADTPLAPSGYRLAELVRPLIRASAVVLVGTLFCAALLLWVRRAVGALSTPLPAPGLVGVGIGVAAIAIGARSFWNRTGPTRWSTFAVSGLVSVSALAFAAAASLPNSTALGLGGLWFAVAVEELWSWWPRRRVLADRGDSRRKQPLQRVPDATSRAQFEQAVADSALGVQLAQEHVTQQLTRVLEPDGTERVVGWMRVSFEVGQRMASVHLAFCPPFRRTPEATLERLDGPRLRIKRVQVFPFGARFDLKLGASAEQRCNVLLQVAAELTGHDPAEEVMGDEQGAV